MWMHQQSVTSWIGITSNVTAPNCDENVTAPNVVMRSGRDSFYPRRRRIAQLAAAAAVHVGDVMEWLEREGGGEGGNGHDAASVQTDDGEKICLLPPPPK